MFQTAMSWSCDNSATPNISNYLGVKIMTVERITFAIVGTLIMATIGAFLATNHPYFLYASAFIGFMVFQAPFTKFCPLPMILKMMGVRTGSLFE
jgi:hypothetical protein